MVKRFPVTPNHAFEWDAAKARRPSPSRSATQGTRENLYSQHGR